MYVSVTGRPSQAERIKELTDKLEQGVKDLFESDRFTAYLSTMSKFHQYSFNNILLIALQCPHATYVAGYQAWKRGFGRTVKRGEKGIRILAPCPYKIFVEQDKYDPDTRRPILDSEGNPVRETVLVTRQSFKIVTVFDVSQTEGKELPRLGVEELSGTVAQFPSLSNALEQVSPVPVRYEAPASPNAKGSYSHLEQCVYVRPGMSQVQTLKTLIHEVAHASLHAQTQKDRRTREVEAESVAYVVCQHFGVDTADYSFGYVAGWSSGKETEELKASLDCIRTTAAGFIDAIETQCPELFPKLQGKALEKHLDTMER